MYKLLYKSRKDYKYRYCGIEEGAWKVIRFSKLVKPLEIRQLNAMIAMPALKIQSSKYVELNSISKMPR
ncbi:hypothetical protein A3197_11110 [Candidatus Thiodiazotropha endoloripes]|nr:hypothetical protein A3197_11110 [Candidatus Thiodiazotropha endoloripes]